MQQTAHTGPGPGTGFRPLSVLIVFLAWTVLFPAWPARAQSYLVHQYGVDTGLPHPTVYGMTQHRDGRIWFATQNGIAAFDGLEWTSYISPNDLPADTYRHICTDNRHRIWAAAPMTKRMLSVFDGRAWTAREGPEELVHDRSVELTGLAVLASNTGETVLLGTLAHGLWLLKDESWHRIVSRDGLIDQQIHSVMVGRDRFYVASGRGLATVSATGEINTALTAALPPECATIRAIQVVCPPEDSATGTPSPELWVLTDGWIGSIRESMLQVAHRHVLRAYQSEHIQPTLQKGPGQAIFYATRYDLFYLDLESSRVERLGRSSGLNNEGATDLLLDREGNIWISGSRGVSKIASMRFGTLRSVHGLLEDEVTAVCEPRAGTLVFGHNNGITISDNGLLTTKAIPDRQRNRSVPPRILDMYRDDDGTVWLAGSGAGLGHLQASGSWRWQDLPAGVNSVLRDGAGQLLAGTNSGVFVLDGDRFVHTDFVDPHCRVRRLFSGNDGSTYIATMANGLFCRRAGRTDHIPGPDKTAVLNVYSILEDREGRFWVGTRAGLYIKENGRLVRPANTRLVFPRAVFFIVQDETGLHWFGTDDGLFCWDGEALRHYTMRDGLAGRETNRAAALVDHSGRLWVGTDSGVSVYRKAFTREHVPPLVQLDHLLSGDDRYALGEPLSLDHQSNTLEFHYRAVSFLDERGILYSYRLEGFEQQWRDPVPAGHRSVRYTNLPPGRYRFLLRAANAEGIWSSPVVSNWIVINKPFWNRWWFYLCCVLLLGLLVYLANATLLQYRYTAKLESEVNARTVKLAESENRYRLLFDNAAVAKLLIHPEGTRILEANDSACRLTGVPRRELVGAAAGETGAEWLQELGRRIVAVPHNGDLEFTGFQQPGGENQREVEVHASFLTIDGEPRVLAMAQDITEKRRLESERLRASKLESLGLLAGGIAHDFNNYLTGILGNISLARRLSSRGDDVTDLLEEAEESVPRARHLTSLLLTFAKGGTPVRRPLDLARVAQSAASFSVTGSGITCVCDIEETLWPVEADEGQMGQVVSNLVINAVQASNSRGKITLSVSNCEPDEDNRRVPPEGPSVKLTVQDEGAGIDPRIMDQIFDPYFSTRDSGSGLGLATVYSIVTRHQGTVKIESVPGAGTTAMVLIPASPGAVIEEDVEEEEMTTLEPIGKGRVLVMDDEQSLRRYYHRVLTFLGYQPETVPDGESAINLYLEAAESGRPFELVILDLTVPGGMGGEETFRILRQEDPDVRAIVSSGYSNDPVVANHREAGFVDLLRKPLSTSDLARVMRRVQEQQDS